MHQEVALYNLEQSINVTINKHADNNKKIHYVLIELTSVLNND